MEIISTVITDIAEGDTVTERSAIPQTITVSVSASSEAEGSSVSGTNLWTLTVYYTPNADGSVDPVLGSTTASLTAAQGNTDLTAGDDLLLEGVETTNVDVSGLVCPEVRILASLVPAPPSTNSHLLCLPYNQQLNGSPNVFYQEPASQSHFCVKFCLALKVFLMLARLQTNLW